MKEFGPNIFQRLEQGSRVRRNFLEQARIASVVKIIDPPLSEPEYKSWFRSLPKPVKTFYAVGTTSLSLLTAACGPSEIKPSTSQSGFEYPFSGLWYLTAGPHSDGLTEGVRAALDFAQPEVVACPGGKPLENRFVEASASGKVAIVGNEKDPTDKNHSIVEIDHGQGLRTGYMHLANMLVRVGQEVRQGERLGNPSCEIPPGGETSGIHLHWYAKKDGKFLPADGIKFPQGQIKASSTNKDGTLTGPDNLVRTADKRRCGPDESSIKACGGIRNDLDKAAQTAKTTETVKPPEITPTTKLKVLPVKTENLQKHPGGTMAEEGWKWIRVQMVLENTSAQELSLPSTSRGAKVTTSEGFTYEATGCDLQDKLSLPPTFRVRGHVFPTLGSGGFRSDEEAYWWTRRLLEICSKVPGVSTDYTLRYPDSSEINVTRSFVDPDKLKYPTDRPDADFNNVGITFNIPNKGAITIVDLSKDDFLTSEWRNRPGNSDIIYKLKARFVNESKGQNNSFFITLGEVFGTDGFIYHPNWPDYRNSAAKAGQLVGSIGPSLAKDFEVYFALPGWFPGGKLFLGGDIKAILNFNLK